MQETTSSMEAEKQGLEDMAEELEAELRLIREADRIYHVNSDQKIQEH